MGAVKASLSTVQAGLGNPAPPCYGRATLRYAEGIEMAEEEPILVSPPTQDVAVHVRDYMRFTQMLKWGALIVLVIAFIVLLILK